MADRLPRASRRVLLVFSDALLRDLVVGLLNNEQDIRIVHICPVDEYVPAVLDSHAPDVVVTDRMSASELQGLLDEMARRVPGAHLVSVSLHHDGLTVYRGRRRANPGVADLLAAVRNSETA
jgi:DNA-binding NarL/FixJ family response regulator